MEPKAVGNIATSSKEHPSRGRSWACSPGATTDMHAGELGTSVLLHVSPHVMSEGNSTVDFEAPIGRTC